MDITAEEKFNARLKFEKRLYVLRFAECRCYDGAVSAAFKKGNDLEHAVRVLEETILSRSPHLVPHSFQIQNKRVIVSEDVRHEIDIWVSVNIGPGYEAIFIFECKNWEEKVGKNEIIVFSEKIDVTRGQKGFFVAKSFTKDAIAQAAKDSRIEMIVASEVPPESVPLPFSFHFIECAGTQMKLVMNGRVKDGTGRERLAVCDVVLDGVRMSLEEIGRIWGQEIWNDRSRKFRSQEVPTGLYHLSAEGMLTFEPNRLLADGQDIAAVTYKVEFVARVQQGVVESCFDVATRGRSLRLAPFRFGNGSGEVSFTFVQASPRGEP